MHLDAEQPQCDEVDAAHLQHSVLERLNDLRNMHTQHASTAMTAAQESRAHL
jgi:hypothetical protein